MHFVQCASSSEGLHAPEGRVNVAMRSWCAAAMRPPASALAFAAPVGFMALLNRSQRPPLGGVSSMARRASCDAILRGLVPGPHEHIRLEPQHQQDDTYQDAFMM